MDNIITNDVHIGLIIAHGISYAGTLPKIRKSPEPLQPVFEAFTNSLEAIRASNSLDESGQITLKLYHKNSLFPDEPKIFDSFVIQDSGIGFNNVEFERLNNLNDNSKAIFNKGSGRVQYLHYFDTSEYTSVFRDSDSLTGFKERSFRLSKSLPFLKKNAIVSHDKLEDVTASNTLTTLSFKTPLLEKDALFYSQLTIEELKEKLITHYLAFFCENKNSLPVINLQYLVDQKFVSELSITSNDLPEIDQQTDITINYKTLLPGDKELTKTQNSEIFNLKSFKINKEKLKKNALKLVSKGEIAQEIRLESLMPEDFIDDKRYLFLLSGDYINNKDGDTRGKLNIATVDDFRKSFGEGDVLFRNEEILIDDIQDQTNNLIISLYDEIKILNEAKEVEIEKLREMFLLNPESIADAKIKLNDSEERILEKVYQSDAKLIAKKDAEIKKRVDALNELDPSRADFEVKFSKEIKALTKAIPAQNRTALTRYVARRKLVLELLTKILDKKLNVQNIEKRNKDEKLIHNLVFQQTSDKSQDSDLWLLNEDFVYFKGVSEKQLGEIEIDGIKILKENLTDEELKYRDSLSEKRYTKRPDVLLFPDEGKCIIIEFKNPKLTISDHILQINNYASIIKNLSKTEFNFHTFYGYLIGENLDADDIQNKDSAFVNAYHFDYVFKPYYRILGKFGKSDGSLYTEVITYRTLLDRSYKRNAIFLNKLLGNE